MKEGLPLSVCLQIRKMQLQAAREAILAGKRKLERV